jgi:hypothetical protein
MLQHHRPAFVRTAYRPLYLSAVIEALHTVTGDRENLVPMARDAVRVTCVEGKIQHSAVEVELSGSKRDCQKVTT